MTTSLPYAAAPAGLDDGAGAHRVHGGAARGVEVDAGVAAGGPDGAAGLVAGGDVRAGDGRGVRLQQALTLGRAGGAGLDLALLLGLLRGLLGPLLGGGLGLLAGGGLVGGLLLGGGLRVDLVGDRVADGDRLGQGLLGRALGGECGSSQGADDTGGGECGDADGPVGRALHTAGTTVLPGGAGERHEVAGPFLPSRLPG